MKPSIQKIQKLIPQLPNRDIKIAYKLLDSRNFESLLELVNSDIYLVKKNQDAEVIKEEYRNIDLDSIIQLKLDLTDYMSYLDIPSEDNLDDMDYQYFEDYD